MRVMLLSEGQRDFGSARLDCEGALRCLVRRIIGDVIGREVKVHEIDTAALPHLHRRESGYTHKVERAILQRAVVGDCELLVVVVDNDRAPADQRLSALIEGRTAAASNPETAAMANATSLGVAVEAVEAWLLADHDALRSVLGADAVRDPEGITQPKAEFLARVQDAGPGLDETYDAVARAAVLDRIADVCRSFRRFRDDLIGRVPR